ncbi:hypothetical protein [Paludibacterium paludis]|uniref:Uncharacterized protein n=1 Tax=Paludibacterium paludis TaxID=1225769 RepID=A0A918P5Z8_9NEIS|nr:hypothetical protein [Paludibacterium paludis]GGY23785.1 hypothetical protein GCM10011289_29330 [Paludibacterium paludis]
MKREKTRVRGWRGLGAAGLLMSAVCGVAQADEKKGLVGIDNSVPIVIDAGVPAHIVEDAINIIEDKTTLRFRRLNPVSDPFPEAVIRIGWRYVRAEADSRPCLTGSDDPLTITVTSACAYRGFVLRGLAAALGVHHIHRNTTNETPYIVCNDPNTILHDASMILHPARAAYCPVNMDRDSPLNDDPACSATHTTRVDTGGVIGNLSDGDIEQLNKRYPSPDGKPPRSAGATVASIVTANDDPVIRVGFYVYGRNGHQEDIVIGDNVATPIRTVEMFKRGHALGDPDLKVKDFTEGRGSLLRHVAVIPAFGSTTNLVTEFRPFLMYQRFDHHNAWKIHINNPAAAWVRDHPHRVVATYGTVKEPKVRVFDLPLRISLGTPPAYFSFGDR